MESNLNEFDQEPRIRPTLLTVLCILTFIGSTGAIIKSVYNYSTAPQSVKTFISNREKIPADSTIKKDSAMGEGRRNRSAFGVRVMSSVSKMITVENIRKSAIGDFVSGLFTLTGALFIWWLRRKGFYLYVAGTVIGIIVPFCLYGSDLLAVGISSIPSFFGLLFIALYALDFKSLR